MVFEADLQAVKDDVTTAERYQDGLTKLDSLIAKVEARYATLNPAQKAQWEATRLQLPHCREHLLECIANNSIQQQKSRIIRILNNIQVI